jgi:hypothetical protein
MWWLMRVSVRLKLIGVVFIFKESHRCRSIKWGYEGIAIMPDGEG